MVCNLYFRIVSEKLNHKKQSKKMQKMEKQQQNTDGTQKKNKLQDGRFKYISKVGKSKKS